MDKTNWAGTTAALGQKIANDITYVFGVFVSYGEADGPVSPFKLRVVPKDRIWLDLDSGPSLLQLGAKSFITPYDILIAKVTDDVTAFYSKIKPDETAQRMLAKYPDKAGDVREQYKKNLDASMQSTIKALTDEISRCVLQKKDIRDTIAQVKKVLDDRLVALETLLNELDRQLKKYVILWEYNDKGYERYIYITEGSNCEICQKLDGQMFNIEDAKAGVNLAPMHPNCDCYTGILDSNDNLVAVLTDNEQDIDVGEESGFLDAIQTALDIAGLVPVYGEVFDGINAVIYLLRGDYVDAALSGAAMIPIAGWAATTGKVGRKIIKFADKAEDIEKLANKTEKMFVKGAEKAGDEVIESAGKVADDVIGGIKVVDGKVGGKIPVDEYDAIRKSSIKNPEADSITLGKYTMGDDSYIAKAGNDSTYFDLGDDWSKVQDAYDLTDDEMFDYFNKPALDEAVKDGKSIKFSHNPLDHEGTSLWKEWSYIKDKLSLDNSNLIFEGGFWYVK